MQGLNLTLHIMKTLILFLFVLSLLVNLPAQTILNGHNYSKKDAIISASILGATFITAETMRLKINGNQAAVLNMSGIALSAGYSLIVTTKPYKKIHFKVKRWIKMKRNNYKPLICEK